MWEVAGTSSCAAGYDWDDAAEMHEAVHDARWMVRFR
jgi:hypothetical protein